MNVKNLKMGMAAATVAVGMASAMPVWAQPKAETPAPCGPQVSQSSGYNALRNRFQEIVYNNVRMIADLTGTKENFIVKWRVKIDESGRPAIESIKFVVDGVPYDKEIPGVTKPVLDSDGKVAKPALLRPGMDKAKYFDSTQQACILTFEVNVPEE